MKPMIWKMLSWAAICLACVTVTSAQVQTQTTVEHGTPSRTVQVDRAEVMFVAGNDLLLKTEDGQLRHLAVPEGVTVLVDDKQLTVRDLKPGMRLQRTITTTAAPTTVTNVRTVEGTITRVSAPNFVNLRLADGSVQRFRIPSRQKFNMAGTEIDAFGLRPGMKLTATAITETPGLVLTQQVARTGEMPPATPPGTALLIMVTGPLAEDYKEDFHMSGRCH